MSSDGLRHEGEMAASDKDSVYAELRKKGIRAIKVTERIQPVVRKGLAGLRKRDIICLAVIGLLLAVGAVVLSRRMTKAEVRVVEGSEPVAQPRQSQSGVVSSGVFQLAQSRPRRWIELPKELDLATVFKHPHEIYLARYAIPGTSVANSSETRCSPAVAQDFFDNLNAGLVISERDDASVAELKRIVAGMKEDAKKYLTMPDGISKLCVWLEERQEMERGYRRQYADRVSRGELTKQEANDVFRAMGMEELK